MKGIYKGSGAQLFKHYNFYLFEIRNRRSAPRVMLRNGHYNLKMIMDYQFKWIVKNRNPLSDAYKNTAILAAVRETGHPYYCSEGSVTEEVCQIMLGYGVYTR
jgi:hypothetical protein